MTPPEFVSQIVSLAWLKCAMDEGVKFVNVNTGVVEKNEFILFQNFEHKTEQFVMPKANVSPKGLERCLFEVVGRFIIEGGNRDIQLLIQSGEFKQGVITAIAKIRERASQPLRGSPIEEADHV